MTSIGPLSYVLSENLVHGDAVTMLTHDGQPSLWLMVESVTPWTNALLPLPPGRKRASATAKPHPEPCC